MTVDDIRKIIRGLPGEADVVMAHQGEHVALVGYSVDKKPDGTASCLTLKTAAHPHKEAR